MSPVASKPVLRALGFFALQTALWVVLTVAFATLIQAAGWASWSNAFSFSATSWLPWIAIAPAVFWLARRFPLERGHLWRSVPTHAVACGVCCLLVIWISAKFAPVPWPPGGRGTFNGESRGNTAAFREARERAAAERAGERRPAEHPAEEAAAGEPRAAETRTGTAPAADHPVEHRPGGRGPTERSGAFRGPRGPNGFRGAGLGPPPTTVPGMLRRWAWLGSFWPPFSSTMLRANFSFAVYFIVACIAHTLAYYRRAQERESQALVLTAGLNRAKLDALRAQLQPHFLFNTLNAISTLVHRNPDAADELIADLSELLRLSLQTGDHEVPLARELELLNCYLAIEQIRLGDRLRIVREIDADVTSAMVPTFVLQPLAENAIRHGIEPRRDPGTLTISARRENDRLCLTVADDGVGLKPAATARRGVGIANTEQRLRALHGDAARLEINAPERGGVEVRIVLPLRTVAAVAPAGGVPA